MPEGGDEQAKQRLAALERERDALQRENQELRSELLYLERKMEALKRELFGQSRGEQISAAQLQLALQEVEREKVAQEEAKEVIGYTRRRPRPEEALERLPEELETVTEEIVPEEVKAEPEAYERIGEEVTEELDVLPMKVIRRRIVRPKFKRKAQVEAVPFIAALPARVVPGGLPGAHLARS